METWGVGFALRSRTYVEVPSPAFESRTLLPYRSLMSSPAAPANPSPESTSAGLWSELRARRVPQFVGSYLVGSFVFLQFMDWCAARDFFSADWAILAFRFLALLLPSVILLSWRFGRPGPDQWKKVDKVAVPANVIGAVLLVVFMAVGMPFLRAGQTTVTIEDENGETIQRVVPEADRIKRITGFFFKNDTGDPELDYLVHGLHFMLTYDLGQDMMLSIMSAQYMLADLWRLSPEDPFDIPLLAQRELAENYRCPHFVNGRFAREGEDYVVDVVLYETKSSRKVAEHQYRGKQLPELMDKASVQVRRDLGVPEYHIEESVDLPLAEITSTKPEAFKAYIEGANQLMLRNDYAAAGEALTRARELDPRCGLVPFMLMQVYANGGQAERAPEAMAQTMDLIYTFPERMQFLIKATNYVVQGEQEKRVAILKMWAELYPQDVQASSQLAMTYQQMGDYESAAKVLEEALKIDDNRGEFYIMLGSCYELMGDFDGALDQFKAYTAAYPESTRGLNQEADVYRNTGRYQDAWETYERIVVLEPDNFSTLIDMASVREWEGRFDEALALLAEAEKDAGSVVDQASASGERASLLAELGRIREAIEVHQACTELRKMFDRPFSIAFRGIDLMAYHMRIGDTVQGLTYWQMNKPMFKGIFADGEGFYRAIYGVALENPDTIRLGIEQVQRFSDAFGADPRFLVQMRSELLKLEGKPEEAVALYGAFIENRRGQIYRGRVDLAELQRLAGDLDAAQQTINEVLELLPRYAEALMEAAEIAKARGDAPTARKHLDELLRVWSDADPDFGGLLKAQSLRAELAEAG